MAFNVDFYVFTKEVNSTALPSSLNSTTFSCKANDRVDIINPVIVLQRGMGGANTPTDGNGVWFNFCYIPMLKRYYFIENWSWEGGLWSAHCTVDVLATYKTQIGNLSAYVVRSSNSFDGSISDAYYPARQLYEFYENDHSSPWVSSIEFGTVVVGIACSGSTNYYKFTYANFLNFIQSLFSNDYAESVVGKLQLSLYSEAKAIVDPLQYITSVVYIPFQDWTDMTNTTLTVGFGEVETNCKPLPIGSTSSNTISTTIIENIPSHPWASIRGVYLNYAPWTEYYIDVPPFGSIPLDPSKFRGAIKLDYHIDWATGNVILRIWGEIKVNNAWHDITEISVLKGQLGVNIEVGQVINRGMGILSHIQHGANLVSQIMGGTTGGSGYGKALANQGWGGMSANVGSSFGAIASGLSGLSGWIRDAIESKIPSVNTVGSLGSFVELFSNIKLFTKCIYPTLDDVAHRGRPLCAKVLLSTLANDPNDSDKTGFMMVADPDVNNIAGTANERDMISAFLVGGFYLA